MRRVIKLHKVNSVASVKDGRVFYINSIMGKKSQHQNILIRPPQPIASAQMSLTLVGGPNTNFEIQILQEENKLLREELNQTTRKYTAQLEHAINKDKLIEELRMENQLLRQQIAELNGKIDIMQTEINVLTKKLDDKETRKLYVRCRTAIQDLNALCKLENKISGLEELREHRNNDSHYVYNEDCQNLVNYKIKRLHFQLVNLDESNKLKFNEDYPNVLDKIISFIRDEYIPSSGSTKIKLRLQEDVDDWWTLF
jgi:hypothetical protein